MQSTAVLTCCFSSTTAASGAQEVADLRAPWQKAPDAERGASKGVQATLPGYREATILACTPPILNPHMPAHVAQLTGQQEDGGDLQCMYKPAYTQQAWSKSLLL